MRQLITKIGMILLVVCLVVVTANAQRVVSGTVTDDSGTPVSYANVYVKGTTIGTTTDLDGNYSLKVPEGASALMVNYVGFKEREIDISDGGTSFNVNMSEGTELDEVVVTGTRGKPRTVIGSAVPIDNINAADLRASGQKTVDQMLNFKVPSYNSSNQTISDATAHFDPSELRNLGPSRTLVLVNGKRKNQSALVYVNDTPGKGEVGTDMKSIPQESIERIEVLRDGAAAQYGSDAVAGVINIVLKERTDGEVSLGTGITTQGDGLTYDAAVNKGFAIGNGGSINLTASYYHQDETNRAGEPGGDGLFGVIFGDDDILNGTHPWIQENPDLGMTVGQPNYDKVSALANIALPYGTNNKAYVTAGYTRRDGTSYALFRAPYWIPEQYGGSLEPGGTGADYGGFQPTFETGINDITLIAGTQNDFNGWKTDLSVAYGSNDVAYTIGNTVNTDLVDDTGSSPSEFDAGAYAFSNIVGNLDISKSFVDDALTVFAGTEARQENFVVTAGQEESYYGGGAQSFPGLQPSNALDESRTNVGVYLGADYDATENTLLGGALRFENYSDFGSNLSWKLNARQFFADKNAAVRASVSTGFRAPSLHQIYLSNIQTLVSGGTVSNQGTFNNVSDVIRGLGVPALDAETSFNITAGLTYRLTDNFSVSADYYNITVDNRVLFTGEIGFDGDDMNINPVEEILIANSVTSIKYFVNALDTRTNGFDLVADYRGLALGDASSRNKLDAVLSLNLNQTTITNDEITSPGVVGDVGYEIFNRKEQSRITSARPNTKALLGLTFRNDRLRVGLNNTYFGSVTWQHASDASLDQTFDPRLVTDLLLGVKLVEGLNLDLTVNNVFNVYPEVIDPGSDFVTDLGGRFQYPWEVNQFGFLGTVVKLGLSYQF